MPGVSIGILLWIGDLRQRTVHLLSFLRGRRPVEGRAHEGMPKPHSHAELGQARLDRGRRRFGADSQPRRGPHSTAGSPIGWAAAISSRRRVWSGRTSTVGGRSRRCHRTIASRWEAEICRLAAAKSIPEAIPARPAGCRVSRRGADHAPAYRAAQSAQNPAALARLPPAAPRSSAPPTRQFAARDPDRKDHANRFRHQTARNEPKDLRRVRSSHCSSSTKHTRGCFSATSDSRPRIPSPTKNRSGTGPALTPKAVRTASRCGAGKRSGHPARARTADATRRTAAPSPTAHPRCGLDDIPTHSPPGSQATRSYRHPLRQTPPTPNSHQHEHPRRTGRACRARRPGQSAPSRNPAP
jgi:hypothetical protein